MNSTVNGSSCSVSLNPAAEKIGKTFAYCLIFIVSLVGNSFIGIVVYKTQTLRKPINYFIVNMAMSDLLLPIFFFPWRLTDLYMDSRLSGSLGQTLCKLVPFLTDASSHVSSQSLVLITVDRFGAVVFPLRSPLISSKLCAFFILATWIIALTFVSPYLFGLALFEYADEKQVCKMQWNETFGPSTSFASYSLASYVVFRHVPIAFLTILYSIILIKLKKQKIPGEPSVNAEKRRTQKNGNVLKIAIAIVVGFALCWVPISIMHLLIYFEHDLSCSFWLYMSIAHFMAVSNCAVNPCICFIFSSSYRQGLQRLLKCFNAAQNRGN